MPIYLGNNEVSLFKGSAEISEGYLGSTLVYQNAYDLIDDFSSYSVRGYNPSSSSSTPASGFGLTKQSDTLRWQVGGGKQTVSLAPAIDLTDYKRLVFTVSSNTVNSSKKLRVGFGTNSNAAGDTRIAYIDIDAAGTFTVNLSSVSGSYYFLLRPYTDSGYTGYVTFSEILLK